MGIKPTTVVFTDIHCAAVPRRPIIIQYILNLLINILHAYDVTLFYITYKYIDSPVVCYLSKI